MTTTSNPPVQPVKAWAVVGNDGKIDVYNMREEEHRARLSAPLNDEAFPFEAPHRVIRVEIREIEEPKA